jgi:hypothetical protein
MEDQNEPTPSNAQIDHFVHRMGCIFSSNFWTNIVSQSTFFLGYWCFLVFTFFFNVNLHTTLPSRYPIDLPTMLTYILTLPTN